MGANGSMCAGGPTEEEIALRSDLQQKESLLKGLKSQKDELEEKQMKLKEQYDSYRSNLSPRLHETDEKLATTIIQLNATEQALVDVRAKLVTEEEAHAQLKRDLLHQISLLEDERDLDKETVAKLEAKMRDYDFLTEKVVDLKGQLEKHNEEKQEKFSQQFLEVWNRARETRDERWLLEPLETGLGDVQTVLKELYSFKIMVLHAKDLPEAKNNRSGRRAYATLTVNDQTRKTQVIHNTTNPEWKQEFVFVFENKPENFRIDVWDYDDIKDDAIEMLGSVEYSLADFYKFNGATTAEAKLDLESYTYVPSGSVEVQLHCRLVPQTVVRWLSGYGHNEISRLLRFASASVNKCDQHGRTPLMEAAINNRPDAALTFVLAQADTEVHDANDTKLTALMYAAIYGNHDVVKVLVEDGKANVEARDMLSRTPLMFAAKNGRIECAKRLIEAKADLDAIDQDGLTALMMASLEGHAEMAHLLIEAKSDLEARNKMGMTSLMITAVRDHPKVAKILLDAGADKEAKDNNGLTPLIIGCLRGQIQIVKLLLEHAADIEAREKTGRTALMYAGFQGQVDIINLLVKEGAVVGTRDYDGRSASMIAADNQQQEASKLLRKFENLRK
jgi:ankyrin repeat protein